MSKPPPQPPRRRWLRWLLIGLAVLLLLPVAALAVLYASFDPEAQKPRIAAAVEQATGRRLTLAGPVGLKLSLVPTVTLQDVALANMPGGSRPEMATARRVEVQMALLPLLSRRVEVRRLVLVAPDILLETDAEGRPNWAFTPAPAAAPAAPADGAAPATTPEEAARPLAVAVERLSITEGRIAYRDGQTGRTRALTISRLETEESGSGGPLRLDGALALDGVPFTLQGETGSLARLAAPEPDAAPWPLRLALAAEGARLTVEGGIARPREAKGWQVAVTAAVPDLARLAPLLPDAPLPPLRDLALSARLAEAGGAWPEVADLRLTAGESDLNALLPGLRLQRLLVTLPRQDQPLALEAAAQAGALPLRLAGTLGAPALLLPGAAAGQNFPLDLTAGAGEATASLRGGIADPRGLSGIDLALALRVPDLAALAPLAGGAALPPLRDVALDTRLAERGPGFQGGAFLRGLRAASSAGDLAGGSDLCDRAAAGGGGAAPVATAGPRCAAGPGIRPARRARARTGTRTGSPGRAGGRPSRDPGSPPAAGGPAGHRQ
ncbi:AsmA family protein [Siccirubricoccus sp. G192]|nr:AsmA family protein [Siccirubricoccus sp. G192]